MASIPTYLAYIRVINCVLASAAILLGGHLTLPEPNWTPIILAAVAAFFTCAAGNAVNDLFDIEIDRVNRPDRVLPAGEMTVREARWTALASHALAVLFGALVNWWVLGSVATGLVLLFLYNRFLKRVPLAGNLIIALLSGLTFVTGGLAADIYLTWHVPGPLIPAVFAVLFHMVREILKDSDDLLGDRGAGVSTLPSLIGPQKAVGVALGLFFILVLLTYVPVYFMWFSRAYEVITIYLVDLPLLGLLIFIWGNPTRRLLRIGSLALKVGMLLGILALFIADQQK